MLATEDFHVWVDFMELDQPPGPPPLLLDDPEASEASFALEGTAEPLRHFGLHPADLESYTTLDMGAPTWARVRVTATGRKLAFSIEAPWELANVEASPYETYVVEVWAIDGYEPMQTWQ